MSVGSGKFREQRNLRRSSVVLLAAGAMLIAACGSSDSAEPDDAAGSPVTADTSADPSVAPSDGSTATPPDDAESPEETASGTEESPDTTALPSVDDSSEDASAVTAPASTGDADFCGDMMASVAMQTGAMDDDVEERFNRAVAELDDLRSRAPAEVVDDVETLYAVSVGLDEALAANGYDIDALSQDDFDELAGDTPGAMDRIDAFCNGSSGGGGATGTASTASGSGTVTIGDQEYQFAVVDDGGSCSPSWTGGIAFRALLTRIDDQGEPVEMVDLADFTQGIDILLPLTDEGEALIFGNLDGAWSAGNDQNDASSVDEFTIDGNRASGTATFVNETGDVVTGSFEVSCGP